MSWTITDSPSQFVIFMAVRLVAKIAGAGGCVFVNSAPTYIFNAKKYPQAAAHAWLIQNYTPNHPGSTMKVKPLYCMGDSAQNSKNRSRICRGRGGWAGRRVA